MDNIKTWTGLSVEESIRMTEDRDKWRKYVHGVANPRIEDGYRTEQKDNVNYGDFRALVMSLSCYGALEIVGLLLLLLFVHEEGKGEGLIVVRSSVPYCPVLL